MESIGGGAVRRRAGRAGTVAAVEVGEASLDVECVVGDERDVDGRDTAIDEGELDDGAVVTLESTASVKVAARNVSLQEEQSR